MATFNILCLHLMILSLLFVGAGGYYSYQKTSCVFSYFDISDLEYINTYYFNKDPLIQFNSTVGKFVGYTEFGVKNAERWNNDPNLLAQMRAERDRYCKPNVVTEINNILSKAVQPKVKLSLEKKARCHHPAILMCSAYDFYPPAISVSWMRDGLPVTSDVTATEEMANGDWYYQAHTHMIYTPKFREKISCVVEHASFKRAMIYDWHGSGDYREVCNTTETS